MAYTTVKDLLIATCDAVRTKDGTDADINHQDIPQRILDIPSGGLPSWMTTGTVTVAENTATLYVNHGGSTKPYLQLLAIEYPDAMDSVYTQAVCIGIICPDGTTLRTAMSYTPYNNSTPSAFANTSAVSEVTETGVKFITKDSNYYFRAGYTYRWICLFHESEG